MYIILDLETTGVDPQSDKIIEFAAIKIDPLTLTEIQRLEILIHPEREIPEIIEQITWIGPSMLKDCPIFSDVSDDIQAFLGNACIIGHNITFDVSFLKSHGIHLQKNSLLDTFFFSNFLFHDAVSLSLWHICESLWIELTQAHRAMQDVEATYKLFLHIIDHCKNLGSPYKDILFFLLSNYGARWYIDFASQFLSPSLLSSKDELFSFYVQHIFSHRVHDETQYQESDKDFHDDFWSFESFISSIDGYESRENQNIMADIIDKNIKSNGKVVIEAATWVGKTFAYLIPAIFCALREDTQIFVSTSTKALQDQIYFKDLAFLSSYFPQNLRYTKIKGKKNYFSFQAFEQFILDIDVHISSEKLSFILKMFFWSVTSSFWELDECDYYGEEYQWLTELQPRDMWVQWVKNPYSDIEFYLIAREKALKSHIVVCNTHVLLSDIYYQGGMFSGEEHLIIDEAHQLEDITTQISTQMLSLSSLLQWKNICFHHLKKIDNIDVSLMSMIEEFLFDMGLLFEFSNDFFSKNQKDMQQKSILLEEAYFSLFSQELGYLPTKLWEKSEQILEKLDPYTLSLFPSILALKAFRETLKIFYQETNPKLYIYYLSKNYTGEIELCCSLLTPWKFLSEKLWSESQSVVLTSATLQYENNFEYLDIMLGIQNFQKHVLESDFAYEKQAHIFFPQDLGNVKDANLKISNFLFDFYTFTGGRTLTLFTSFAQIKSIYSIYKLQLQKQGITLLAQSLSGGKQKILYQYKKNAATTVLLGTDSFWEGIDIAGNDLEYLIIHKIPFQVPSDPIFQARGKLFQNSFSQYAVPKAILKLKQGIGRLIRTKNDTGWIILLDDRITGTSWGKAFFAAFPKNIQIHYGESQELFGLIAPKE